MRGIVPPLLLAAACGSRPAPAPAPAPVAAAAAGSAVEASSAPAPSSEAASASAAASATPPPVGATPPRPAPPRGGVVLVGDIVAPGGFDPNPVVKTMKPRLLDCFNEARAAHQDLHGKLTLHVQVNEAGKVLTVDGDPSGQAYDRALVACIGDAMKANARFPRPGGTATVNVPLVFHR